MVKVIDGIKAVTTMILSKLFRAYESDMHIPCDHRPRSPRRACNNEATTIIAVHRVDQCNEPKDDARSRIMLRCNACAKTAVHDASVVLARKRAEAYERARRFGGRRRVTCNTCGLRLAKLSDMCAISKLAFDE